MIKKIKILSGGSDRIFLKIKELKNSVILKDSDEIQFLNYIKIGNFLNKKMLSAPKIYFYDLENKIAIIEDLGDKSIFKIYKRDTFNLYKRIIDFLIELQFKAREGFLNLSLKRKKIFDYESLRWETDYFKREFLINFLKFKEEKLREIDRDFDKLARECDKMPKLFMHRDFQSTNIFLKQNKIRIIDFQTAHIGPFTYDLSSLLEDPYVEINENVKEKLLFYYYDRIKDRFRKMSFDEFYHYYLLTSSQRLMQALGAYSYLSLKKKKKWFKKFIKPAFKKLKIIEEKIRFFHKIIR
ncbi:MAG: phosphotransferase [candidate division WOR-3 bacterium]